MKQIALVTGGARGLGFETCRHLGRKGVRVILAARNKAQGENAAATLQAEGLDVVFQQLDVTNELQIQQLDQFVRREFGRLDILINNAGVLLDKAWPATEQTQGQESALLTELECLRKTMEVNVYGVFRLCQTFIPLMQEHGFGRIVNVSSLMGQLETMNGGYAAYRISKTALNAVTRVFAAELEGSNVLINSVSPGWVRTEMGGPGAPLSLEEGVDTIAWMAMQPDGTPSGGFFKNREKVRW